MSDILKESSKLYSNRFRSFILSYAKPFLVLGLASLQPVANFTLINISEPSFDLGRVALYFFLIFSASCLVLLLISLAFRPRNIFVVTLPIAALILFFFNYHLSVDLVNSIGESAFGVKPQHRYVLIVHSLLFLLSLLILHKVAVSPKLVVIFTSSLAILPIADLGMIIPELNALRTTKTLVAFEMPPKVNSKKQASSKNTKPNVYFILPDAMPAPDMVSEIIGGYEYKLTDQLKRHGFHMIENAASNAILTNVSVPHFFAMEYFIENDEKISVDKFAAMMNVLKGYNPVVAGFRLRGYKYFQVNGDSHVQACGGYENVCMGVVEGITPLDMVFLSRTIVSHIAIALQWSYREPLDIPDITERLPDREEGPFFLHAHFAIPHIPYRYDSDCSKYEKPIGYGNIKLNQDLLGKQVACAEKQLDQMVSEIIKKDPKAIIVVQSDHGISHQVWMGREQLSMTNDTMRQSNAIFSAFYLPDACASHLRPGLSPVNTFRIVFACLDGHPPVLLKDRAFITDINEVLVKEIYPRSNRRVDGTPVKEEIIMHDMHMDGIFD